MSPDSDLRLRLRLRVAVKLLVLTGGIVCGAVAVGFIFNDPDPGAAPVARVSLAGLAPGETRTVGWQSRAVIVLHRKPATTARLGGQQRDGVASNWLVAHARGTGQGCPVVWQPERHQFRESCGDARYDAAGQPVGGDHPPLEQPPHHVEDDVLIIGRD